MNEYTVLIDQGKEESCAAVGGLANWSAYVSMHNVKGAFGFMERSLERNF